MKTPTSGPPTPDFPAYTEHPGQEPSYPGYISESEWSNCYRTDSNIQTHCSFEDSSHSFSFASELDEHFNIANSPRGSPLTSSMCVLPIGFCCYMPCLTYNDALVAFRLSASTLPPSNSISLETGNTGCHYEYMLALVREATYPLREAMHLKGTSALATWIQISSPHKFDF